MSEKKMEKIDTHLDTHKIIIFLLKQIILFYDTHICYDTLCSFYLFFLISLSILYYYCYYIYLFFQN
jgi:hypothetical protein